VTAVNFITGLWIRGVVTFVTGETWLDRPYSTTWNAAKLYLSDRSNAVGNRINFLVSQRLPQNGTIASPTTYPSNTTAILTVHPPGAEEIEFYPASAGGGGFTDTTDILAPRGKKMRRVLSTLATATVDFPFTYRGTFRAFLRCRRTGGNATDFTVRLAAVNTSTSAIDNRTDPRQISATTDKWCLDMGTISINVGTLGAIRAEVTVAVTGATLDLYDLIMIPVAGNSYVLTQTLSDGGGFTRTINGRFRGTARAIVDRLITGDRVLSYFAYSPAANTSDWDDVIYLSPRMSPQYGTLSAPLHPGV
jgi:hypothetical protein